MNELLWLWTGFVVLNILDVVTTWMGLHHLPPELRAKEANPLFRAAEHSMLSTVVMKVVLVLIGLWVFLYLYNRQAAGGVFTFRVLDLVLFLAVINNMYVYTSRRVKRRMTQTPIGITIGMLQRLRLPSKAARVLAFLFVMVVLVTLSYFVVAVTI